MSLWERDDWPGMFASLRQNRPVSWHTEPEIPGLTSGPGTGFWSLVRYDDVVRASRPPDVFISGQGTNIPDFPPEVYEFLGSMINMDPPRHTQFRLIVNRGFTPTAHMLVRRGHPRDGRWTRPGAGLCFVAIPIVRSEANALAKAIMASGRRWLLSPSTSYVAATRLWPQ